MEWIGETAPGPNFDPDAQSLTLRTKCWSGGLPKTLILIVSLLVEQSPAGLVSVVWKNACVHGCSWMLIDFHGVEWV